MCRMASFFHNPQNGDVVVADLTSHGNTETILSLNKNIWREGHYLPSGEIELRFNPNDVKPENYEENFKIKFPTFTDFLNWAIMSCAKDRKLSGFLDLRGLTSAKGLVLPKSVGGFLDLRGLTSAKGLVLPKSVGSSLYLNGLTSAKGLVLPKSVGSSLDLRGADLSEGAGTA